MSDQFTFTDIMEEMEAAERGKRLAGLPFRTAHPLAKLRFLLRR